MAPTPLDVSPENAGLFAELETNLAELDRILQERTTNVIRQSPVGEADKMATVLKRMSDTFIQLLRDEAFPKGLDAVIQVRRAVEKYLRDMLETQEKRLNRARLGDTQLEEDIMHIPAPMPQRAFAIKMLAALSKGQAVEQVFQGLSATQFIQEVYLSLLFPESEAPGTEIAYSRDDLDPEVDASAKRLTALIREQDERVHAAYTEYSQSQGGQDSDVEPSTPTVKYSIAREDYDLVIREAKKLILTRMQEELAGLKNAGQARQFLGLLREHGVLAQELRIGKNSPVSFFSFDTEIPILENLVVEHFSPAPEDSLILEIDEKTGKLREVLEAPTERLKKGIDARDIFPSLEAFLDFMKTDLYPKPLFLQACALTLPAAGEKYRGYMGSSYCAIRDIVFQALKENQTLQAWFNNRQGNAGVPLTVHIEEEVESLLEEDERVKDYKAQFERTYRYLNGIGRQADFVREIASMEEKIKEITLSITSVVVHFLSDQAKGDKGLALLSNPFAIQEQRQKDPKIEDDPEKNPDWPVFDVRNLAQDERDQIAAERQAEHLKNS
ncbi:MAG: hypothetical protein WC777_02710 [Candidatus Gracilibacteria bacterium]|jgi:hypothetical protein